MILDGNNGIALRLQNYPLCWMILHQSTFYCLNCLYLFRTESKRDSHGTLCINHDFCDVVLPVKSKKKQ